MKIRIYNFSSAGGAGNVSRALGEGFRAIGHEVDYSHSTSSSIRENPLKAPKLTIDALIDNHLFRSPEWETLLSLNRDRHQKINPLDFSADLTIFRWMNGLIGGLLSEDLKIHNPISWGLADMNPFTSVCHYSGACTKYESGCSSCPAVRRVYRDKVVQHFDWKRQVIEKLKPTFISPTDWIHRKAKSAILTRGMAVEKILNPLPFSFFENENARPSSKKLRILIVAVRLDDEIKGVWREVRTLNIISQSSKIELSMVGSASKKLMTALPHVRFAGALQPEDLKQEMDLHDVLLVPSLEENAGTVVAEAASRVLPTIARRIGGMPEMTNYGESGYLFSTSTELLDIVNGIEVSDIRSKGLIAQEWASQLRPDKVAQAHIDVHY